MDLINNEGTDGLKHHVTYTQRSESHREIPEQREDELGGKTGRESSEMSAAHLWGGLR